MIQERGDGYKSSRSTTAAWLFFMMLLTVTGMKGEEKPLRQVELLLLESSASGTTVGLYIELSPGWHLYWINPGDAGLAPEVTWELPAGYEAGPLQYPVPEKFVSGDIVAYGYESELLLLCRIKSAEAGFLTKPRAIACRLDWMACQESCVTGQTNIQVSPAARTPDDLKRTREIMARFAPRFPKTLDEGRIAAKEADLVETGDRWRLEIRLSGKDAAAALDFYPYPLKDFVIAHGRITVNDGKVIIPLDPSGPSAALDRVGGLLVLDDDAYEVSVPVKTMSHPT